MPLLSSQNSATSQQSATFGQSNPQGADPYPNMQTEKSAGSKYLIPGIIGGAALLIVVVILLTTKKKK